MVDAIIKEIKMRKDYLDSKSLQSIYFGGGTPSVLSAAHLSNIFAAIAECYTWSDDTEITLEGNPDDFSEEKIRYFSESPINRLSIGVQSFHDEDLRYMNRAHDSQMADKAIKMSQDAGLENITIDLIYGSPTTTMNNWRDNLENAVNYGIPHISSYCLTVEEGTALHHFVQSGKMPDVDDEKSLRQFEMMLDVLADNDFIHYEISNFAKTGFEAVHNSNYWSGEPYLGIGPSAHSYDGKTCRGWNIAHNAKYMKMIENGQLPIENEALSLQDRYNEYVLTNLRTIKGISLEKVDSDFLEYQKSFEENIKRHISLGNITKIGQNNYILTRQGKFVADNITSDFFIV